MYNATTLYTCSVRAESLTRYPKGLECRLSLRAYLYLGTETLDSDAAL